MQLNPLNLFSSDNAENNEQLDKKLGETTAANKSQYLTGIESWWVTARRNDFWYISNKLISMVLAFGMAFLTLMLKLTAMSFIQAQAKNNSPKLVKQAADHMQNIYWLMFIFLCMQGMDEIIELFSQIMQMEKGALGLFFEMNHIVGIGLSIYIMWFIVYFDFKSTVITNAKERAQYERMYKWVYIQYIFAWICLVLSFIVYLIYSKMNARATRKGSDE